MAVLKVFLKNMPLNWKECFLGPFMVNLTLRHTNTQEKFSKRNVNEVFVKLLRKYATNESVARFMEGLFLWS